MSGCVKYIIAKLTMALLSIIVVIFSGAQIAWMMRTNGKFKRYVRGWNSARARWNAARGNNDQCGMLAAYVEEKRFYAAEMAAHLDMLIPPWKWIKRWNIEYLKGVK